MVAQCYYKFLSESNGAMGHFVQLKGGRKEGEMKDERKKDDRKVENWLEDG